MPGVNTDDTQYPFGITYDITKVHPGGHKPVGFFQWQATKGSCDKLQIDATSLPPIQKSVDITIGGWNYRSDDKTFKNVTLPFVIGEKNTDISFNNRSSSFF